MLETGEAAFAEDGWVGRELWAGDQVRLRVTARVERCAMVGFAQDELPADPRVLREIAQRNGTCFGIYAEVLTPGEIRVGDPVRFG